MSALKDQLRLILPQFFSGVTISVIGPENLKWSKESENRITLGLTDVIPLLISPAYRRVERRAALMINPGHSISP